MSELMKVRMVPIEKLVPYERNPRIHSEDQIHQIAESIKEFGFVVPILADKKFGVIAGHGRLMAANLIGMKEVPVLIAGNMTKGQRRAYVIADNKLALNSAWDMELLRDEIRELRDVDFDLDLLGFDPGELEGMLAEPVGTDEGGSGKSQEKQKAECPKCGHVFTVK